MSRKNQVTRVRVEMIGPDASEVTLALTEVVGELKNAFGGQWEMEEPGVATMPSVHPDGEGSWGRVTIRRAK